MRFLGLVAVWAVALATVHCKATKDAMNTLSENGQAIPSLDDKDDIVDFPGDLEEDFDQTGIPTDEFWFEEVTYDEYDDVIDASEYDKENADDMPEDYENDDLTADDDDDDGDDEGELAEKFDQDNALKDLGPQTGDMLGLRPLRLRSSSPSDHQQLTRRRRRRRKRSKRSKRSKKSKKRRRRRKSRKRRRRRSKKRKRRHPGRQTQANCSCSTNECSCEVSRSFKIVTVTAKMSIKYDPEANTSTMALSINDHELFSKEVSLAEFPETCFEVPGMESLGRVCLELYDVQADTLHACAKLTGTVNIKIAQIPLNLELGCFTIPQTRLVFYRHRLRVSDWPRVGAMKTETSELKPRDLNSIRGPQTTYDSDTFRFEK